MSSDLPSSVSIAIAAHKPYPIPNDSMYTPVQVGAIGRESIEGFRRDDEGDGGISVLNPHLSELTAMYWAWKHLDAEAVGLVHYRRHFAGSGDRGTMTSVEALELLKRAPVVLPRERNYIIESVGDHYAHTFDASHLELLLSVVEELSPKYVPALRERLAGTRAHMFNMLLMRRDLFEQYASWMFPIASQIESRMDYSSMTSFEGRSPGRLAEFLVDTWIDTNGIPAVECRVREMETVNWVKKGSSFLAAKFTGRKYRESF